MAGWRRIWLLAAGMALAGATAAAGDPAPARGAVPRLELLSGRPEAVSGGDALVRVVLGEAATAPRITVDGRDVTPAFRPGAAPGVLIGRVDGLRLGRNTIRLVAGGGAAQLQLINHPAGGPVFSGPHQQPFTCRTVESGLGPPLDADCNARPVVSYFYKSTQAPPADARPTEVPQLPSLSPGFKPLDPNAPRPSDVAKITTTEGKVVDYIVRREVGAINRAIYDIEFLHQPGGPLPDPWTSTDGWNRRLVYTFGGGCANDGPGYHQATLAVPIGAQRRGSTGGPQDPFLSQGYAVATSSLNFLGNNCNDRISAETMAMVKEYFAETFGPPVYTMGWGGSGGSMQQHLIAQNYPGLLDGIMPSASYPDTVTMATTFADCALLDRALSGAKEPWTEAQKTAVSGFATWSRCDKAGPQHEMKQAVGPNSVSYSPPWIWATACPSWMSPDLVYDPVKNPKGLRCSIFDNEVNIYGRDPNTGFARRPVDNVGVQYGFVAFNAGVITAAQFVELNERVGGYDNDGAMISRRSVADGEALRIAYREGLVNTGGGGLGSIPIIDLRVYTDGLGDAHDRVRSFAARARLQARHGDAANQVMLTYPPSGPGWAGMAVKPEEGLKFMAQWLDAIAADTSAGGGRAKMLRNRPAGLADACWTTTGEKIVEVATYDRTGRCNGLYPPHADPRIAAGGPLAGDVLKCRLKPLRAEDYARPLGAGQLARLKAVFPEGVCDYGRPGIGQTATTLTWRSY